MTFEFGSFVPTAAQEWFNAAKTGTNVVTRQQRNSAIVLMGGLMDALAAPDRVLTQGSEPSRLPEVPYGGADRQFIGRNVPVVGAMPAPDHWRTGAAAPESLPAWMRASDAERRSLYGALASVLEDLGRSGDPNPAQGTQRSTGFAPAVIALGVVAVAGVAAWACHEVGETAREFIRERAEVQRAAESAATSVKLYLERLRVLRDTGSMPAASPAEVAIQPRAANGAPAPGSPSARGNDWWTRAKDAAPMALGGLAAGAALVLGIAYAIGQAKKKKEDAARMVAGASGPAPSAPPQERAVW